MEAVRPAGLADAENDGEVALLLQHVRARLAEVDARPEGLVAGVWRPWDGLCVVALAGSMDSTTAPELSSMLAGRLGPDPCRLIVELSRVTLMSSSGISQLIALASDFRAAGGRIAFAAPTAPVARAFASVKLSEFTPVVETLEAALSLSQTTSHTPREPRRHHANAGA
jgi:anti-sigma B factor antagonist